MAWQQLKIKATIDNTELMSDILLGLGAEAVSLLDAKDQPLLEPGPGETPLWQDAFVTGLFAIDIELNAIVIQLKLLMATEELDYASTILDDQNWERVWLENFKPLKFGEHLWVCPEEQLDQINDDDAITVILDPGLAFGTGTHPTTALCLAWLEQELHSKESLTVIDYGSGSGILAIAALKLGAKKVYAIDNDPQALIATRENALRNNIPLDRIEIYPPDGIPDRLKADILVANILANPLLALKEQFVSYLNPKAKLALSGILKQQANSITTHYSDVFNLDEPQYLEDWSLVSGTYSQNQKKV